MKRLIKVLLLSAAVLGFTLAPGGAFALCGVPFSECSDNVCVVCFPVMIGGQCGYICRIVR